MNLNVSTMISWVVEKWNDLGFKRHPVMLPDLGIFERIFAEKDVHGLTLFHGSLRITHCFFTSTYPLFYLTGSNSICGVLVNEVEWHLLDSNLLQGQR